MGLKTKILGFALSSSLAVSAFANEAVTDSCTPFGKPSFFKSLLFEPDILRGIESYDQLCDTWSKNKTASDRGFANFIFENALRDIRAFSHLSPMTQSHYIKVLALADTIEKDQELQDQLELFKSLSDGHHDWAEILFADHYDISIGKITLNIKASSLDILKSLKTALNRHNVVMNGIQSVNRKTKSLGYELVVSCNEDSKLNTDNSKYFRANMGQFQAKCVSTCSKLVEALKDQEVRSAVQTLSLVAVLVDQKMQGPDSRPIVWIKSDSSSESISTFLKSL